MGVNLPFLKVSRITRDWWPVDGGAGRNESHSQLGEGNEECICVRECFSCLRGVCGCGPFGSDSSEQVVPVAKGGTSKKAGGNHIYKNSSVWNAF